MKKIYTTLFFMAVAISASAQITLNKPEAKPATNITATGFTANWGAVNDCDGYAVFVYDRKTVTTNGEMTIADEDFNGITGGNINEPLGGDEEYVDLSDYGYAQTYGWSAYGFPNFIRSMVAGLVYSPYLDLRANNGKYKIVVDAYCNNGDEIRIESNGSNGKEIKTQKAQVEGGATGIAEVTFEFENGCEDLFFSVINNTAKEGAPDYFDRIQVKQDMKIGDVINYMVGGNDAVDAVNETTNDSINSCRITGLSKYTSAKVVYYDLYASANDFSTPNGSMPYTFVTSPFADLVKVDMTNKTSEVYDPSTDGILNIADDDKAKTDDTWYNIAGQRIEKPVHGLFINGGKKILVK